jgi:hypothetical protein
MTQKRNQKSYSVHNHCPYNSSCSFPPVCFPKMRNKSEGGPRQQDAENSHIKINFVEYKKTAL